MANVSRDANWAKACSELETTVTLSPSGLPSRVSRSMSRRAASSGLDEQTSNVRISAMPSILYELYCPRMQSQLTGNTKGLKASEIKALERIYRRRVPQDQVVTYELAQTMSQISGELHRQVGVLINRRGSIEHVIVGDASQLFLPDVGRLRGAPGRFRGLRLVHTHLRGEKLTHDDLTDLALLRLDVVAAIGVDGGHAPGRIYVGHLLPDNPEGKLWEELPSQPAHSLSVNFAELMSSLEAEFARSAKVLSTEAGSTKALLVHVTIGRRSQDDEARIGELKELCRTAGVEPLDILTQQRPKADPKYLVGRGKLEQLLLRAMQLGAETVIFDKDLSPGQARAISDFTDLKILDRTMLILDIFAQHAKSRDGKLQVELAQLKYAPSTASCEEHDDESANWRHRWPWSWRNEARDQSTTCARANRASRAQAKRRRQDPPAATPEAKQPLSSSRCDRWLHQRRQVHSSEHPDGGQCPR